MKNAERKVKPMLAVDAKGGIKFPVYASPKLDGIRAIIMDGQVLSRSLKPIPNEYIQHILGSNPLLEGLDGELIVGKANDFNAMQNTSSGVMTRTGQPDFTFYVFDFYTKPDMPYNERYGMLSNPINLQSLEKHGSRVKLLRQTLIRNMGELEAFEAGALKLGYEGVMVRSVDSIYKYGRSTHKEQYLLKVKRFTDSEAIIVGVQELQHNHNEAQVSELGQTKRSTCKDNLVPGNTLGALVVTTEEGVTFNIGTGFTAAKRDELWQMHKRGELVGKLAKYKHFEVGSKEAPRFPVFIDLRNPIDL